MKLNNPVVLQCLLCRATLGQGIRSGCGIVPLTGPGGLQHYATTDRRSSGNLRVSFPHIYLSNYQSMYYNYNYLALYCLHTKQTTLTLNLNWNFEFRIGRDLLNWKTKQIFRLCIYLSLI